MDKIMTILWYKDTNEFVTKQRFPEGYQPPDREKFQQEKQERNIAELVLEKQVFEGEIDQTEQKIEKVFVPDYSVDNEFDGVLIETWQPVDLPTEEKTKRKEEQQRLENRRQIREELKTTPAIRNDLNNPDRIQVLEERIVKLEQLIIEQ